MTPNRLKTLAKQRTRCHLTDGTPVVLLAARGNRVRVVFENGRERTLNRSDVIVVDPDPKQPT